MRLAKLTLSGFKSFADRTEFTFEAPITAIVGPNGCGKSNVVDAIKWVLGERSAKSLRGKEMEDVIFAGSAGRKPMGLASVILTFENPVMDRSAFRAALAAIPDPIESEADAEDADAFDTAMPGPVAPEGLEPRDDSSPRRALNIDAETVDIERRLHRDGQSEYLINGRKARLRDIRELFMDTGVGADAYSIIEQGKVDAMLLASPVERRTIFEEAAGVARFRARRIEAERKLERTESNLVRAREQLDSTERRLRIVKGQAAKARAFQDLDARLKSLKTDLALDQYHDLRTRLEGLTSRLADLETTRRAATEDLETTEAARRDAELTRHEVADLQQRASSRRDAAAHEVSAARQRKDMTERALDEARQQAALDSARLAELDAQAASLASAAGAAREAVAALDASVAEAETRLERLAAERSAAQQQAFERRSILSDRRGAHAQIERTRATLLAEADAEARRASALTEQSTRLDTRATSLAESIDALRDEERSANLSASERRADAASLEARLAELEHDAAALSGDQRALADRLAEFEHERVRLETRRTALLEMIEARVGLTEAARAVLDRKAAGAPGHEQVIAPLADLIEADSAHALAVEAALGPSLQAILVRAGADEPLPLSDLSGRVAFVPAAPHAAPACPPPEFDLLQRSPHSLTPLRSLVRTDPRAIDALDSLLGRAYLVPDLATALSLRKGPLSSLEARFVAITGEVVEPDGRIIAGPLTGEDSGRGLLGRRAEMVELETRLAAMHPRIDADRGALRALDDRAASLDEERADARSRLGEVSRAAAADDARAGRLETERSRAEREAALVRDEREDIGRRLEILQQAREETLARAESMARLAEEQAAAIVSLVAETEALQATLDAAAEALTAARVEASRHTERLGAARRDLGRIEAACEDNARQRRHAGEQSSARNARLAEHEAALIAAAEAIAGAIQTATDAESELAALGPVLHEATEAARAFADRVVAARERAQHVERDWNSLEITRRELEVRREALEERTQQDIALDLNAAYPAHLEARAAVEPGEPFDQAGAAAEIDRLRDEIRRLGNVNLDAIEEEQTLESRNEDLIRQVADIDAASAALADLIRRLSDASRERFRITFETIEAHFAGKDGMFRKLFGGGRAEIRLIPLEATGQVDWLESGVEIIAKPPGKEPRSISQLSGGEKTMTAVALLMAIFQSKPSPFCILDEVDAALDESNVGRFCAVVRQFLDRSHFIVITHNKRTMHEASALYGVTMAERGVSRRVSVRFEDVGSNGHIRTAAVVAESPDPEPDPRPAKPSRVRAALAAMRDSTDPVEAEA